MRLSAILILLLIAVVFLSRISPALERSPDCSIVSTGDAA
jgi:hypothetical protein